MLYPMVVRIPPGEWQRQPGNNVGMERAVALSRETAGTIGLYSAVVTTEPSAATRVHHHGPCETSIYIVSGRARFTWGPGGVENELEAAAGDFVYVPAGEPHVEANGSETEALVVVVTRNCPDSVVIYLDEEAAT
jgi:uncharacterized RmlC-like cupin family protein